MKMERIRRTAGFVVAVYPRRTVSALFGCDVRNVGEHILLLWRAPALNFTAVLFSRPCDSQLDAFGQEPCERVRDQMIRCRPSIYFEDAVAHLQARACGIAAG